jgi:flavin reductase (DIM6/NTAB) family NADH-FMN oxidoreductase RutF
MLKKVPASQALKRKYPEWIDLVVSRGAIGGAFHAAAVNVMPVGWSTIASGTPLLYAVVINAHHHTTRLIRETREFVVAAPSAAMAAATLYCGTHSGRDGEKIEPSGLELVPATVVQVPLLRGAVYNLECTLHAEVESGDHVLFIGQVVAAHVDDEAGPRLMNFGDRWAVAQAVPETIFEH